MRTVIFDLDGTLADTSGDLIAAANSCFCALGHGNVLDAQGDRATAVRGGRAMLALGFERLFGAAEESEIDAQFPHLLRAYGENIDRFTMVYPEVRETLRRLEEVGYRLGVCTNKPEGLADTLLRRLGLRAHFRALIGADTLPTRKPDAAPLLAAIAQSGGSAGRALLIGDTITDRDCARAAGVPCALVTFGPTGDAVADLAPDALLDHYVNLPALVARMIGRDLTPGRGRSRVTPGTRVR